MNIFQYTAVRNVVAYINMFDCKLEKKEYYLIVVIKW